MKPTEEQIHEASRGYYGAFDHMLHDWKPVAGFKAGAKWALDQPRWIAVEERLPYSKEDVLIFFDDQIKIGYYDRFYKEWGCGEEVVSVTFWQPLPEKPKNEEK